MLAALSLRCTDQLTDAIAKTKVVCGVKVERRFIGSGSTTEVVYVQHDFGFLGGCDLAVVICVTCMFDTFDATPLRMYVLSTNPNALLLGSGTVLQCLQMCSP